MSSTITVPDRQIIGHNVQEIANKLSDVAAAAVVDIEALQAADGASNYKAFVRASATANIASLASASVTQDGVTLVEGDRVLLTEQSTGSQNGIYVVGAVAGGNAPLTRATDADGSSEVKPGMVVFVSEGTTRGDRWFYLTTNATITLGTTALTFVKLPDLAELASTATGKGASLVGLEDAAGNTAETDVEGALAEIYPLVHAAPAMQAVDATLATGTITINSGIVVAADSEVIPVLIGALSGSTNFGSLGELKASRVVGGDGVGTVVIQAYGADGALDADAAGAIRVVILTPQ